MEHIVQFAIGIDDEAIQKRIEESGYEDVIRGLIGRAEAKCPKNYSYGQGGVDWRNLVDHAMDRFIEDHKEEIIDAAAEKLCEAIKRTKKFKEAVDGAMK